VPLRALFPEFASTSQAALMGLYYEYRNYMSSHKITKTENKLKSDFLKRRRGNFAQKALQPSDQKAL